jgi:crossover junction endodeoxyribonuclease RuvC
MVVRIIGIDPGLRRTGWGVIESAGTRLSYVACGTVTSDATEALCQRLAALFAGLDAVLARWQPHEAAVEETFVNRDAHATLKLGQARGIALLVPARAGLLVAEYAPNLVKKTVTGSGHAEKVQIRTMIGYLLPKASPDSDDAADALAVAIAHAHHRQAAALKRAVLASDPARPAKRSPAA